jgi:hypothetical protein
VTIPLLRTASWGALYQASKLGPLEVVPVRISLARPRFWPEAHDAPEVEELLIPPWTLKADLEPDEFRRSRASRTCASASTATAEISRLGGR